MNSNQLSTRFTNAYNELSEFMEKELNVKDYMSHVQMLGILSRKNKILSSFYDDLRLFANLRNTIVHDSNSKYNPIAEPHIEVIERYEYILNRVMKPPTALDVCTLAKDLEYAQLKTPIIDCIKRMHANDFTYMPITKNNIVVGVFSGDCIFTFMRTNKTTKIDDGFTITDLGDCIQLDSHLDERFDFVGKYTNLDVIAEMFANDIKDGKRLSAVFVTEHGDVSQKLLGMISPWDLIRYIKEEI